MEVILTGNVSNLGRTGDKVRVTDGYARNFLFPRELAIRASSKKVKELEHCKRLIARKAELEQQEARNLAEKLRSVALTFERKVGEEDKLFGSVTKRDIEIALTEEGYEIGRRWIQLESPLKQLGVYTVQLRLHTNVESSVKVWIVAQ